MTIKSICVKKIHVPLEHKKTIYSITGPDNPSWNNSDSPRYSIELAYGQRHEPWIRSIKPLTKQPANE